VTHWKNSYHGDSGLTPHACNSELSAYIQNRTDPAPRVHEEASIKGVIFYVIPHSRQPYFHLLSNHTYKHCLSLLIFSILIIAVIKRNYGDCTTSIGFLAEYYILLYPNKGPQFSFMLSNAGS
jgi:hypothetical protein